MDDLLSTIVKDAKLVKDESICNACYVVKEVLADRTSLLKSPVYEVRGKCFVVVSGCLENQSGKLKSLAVSVCQKLLRDDHFWICDIADQHLLLPFQLTSVVETQIRQQPENVQIDLLKVLLEMIFFGYSVINSRIIISVISICQSVSSSSKSSSVIEAAEATSSQSVQCFTKYLITDEEKASNEFNRLTTEMVAVFTFICSGISDVIGKPVGDEGKNSLALLLRCSHSILSVLQPENKVIDDSFRKLLWQTFCPLLIQLLTTGKPKHSCSQEPFKESPDNHDFGRGSQNLDITHQKKIIAQKDVFSVSQELIRLFGEQQTMRSVLEALLHRILLYPSVSSRMDTLKYVRDVFNQPMIVVKMSATATQTGKANDLSLLKLFTDCVKECSYSDDQRLINQSVLCVTDLLKSLEKIASGCGMANSDVIRAVLENDDAQQKLLENNERLLEEALEAPTRDECLMRKDFTDFQMSSYKSKLDAILPSSSGSSTPSSLSSPTQTPFNISDDEETTSKDVSEAEEDNKRPSCDSGSAAAPRLRPVNVKRVVERENARKFFAALKDEVLNLLSLRTEVEVDNAVQQFVSSFCKEVWEAKGEQQNQNDADRCSSNDRNPVIINSDGLYFSAYAGFVFNLKLIALKYYESEGGLPLPTSEQKFIDDILKNEVLIYLSPTWLREFYQQILACSVLPPSTFYTDLNREQTALLRLILDCENFNGFSCSAKSHQLSYFRKFENPIGTTEPKNLKAAAGRRLAKRIITAQWHSLTTTLSALFRNESPSPCLFSLLLMDSPKENAEKRETLVECLNSLQITARLCINLGLQSKCNSIYDMLTKSVINPIDNCTKRPHTNDPCLHSAQVLSLHSIFTGALEVASHCRPCWDFVFACCTYVINLEYNHFSKRTFSRETKHRFGNFFRFKKEEEDEMKPNFGEVENVASIMRVRNQTDVSNCLQECLSEKTNGFSGTPNVILRGKKFETALTCLTYLAENVFHDAASRLNLDSLVVFLEALICNSSREFASRKNDSLSDRVPLLFNRFCDVLLKIAKSGRPLLHTMKCWSIAASHLIEAASRKDDICVCKVAVSTINDFIAVVLSTYTELPYFHFNEALFKPYENLLLLELCECDVQEMIVSSICGFVEGFKEELRSGWRSLFCALRGIRLPNMPYSNQAVDAYELEMERVRQLRVVLDIFEAFLSTNHLDIFANAAVDCLLCLLGLLKDSSEDVEYTPDSEENHYSVDLCLLALKYIHQFESLLRSMYLMPACPMFTCTRSIVSCSESKTINIPKFCENQFDFSTKSLLSDFDRPVKILHVWFILLDGLTNAVTFCPVQHQGKIIEMSVSLLGTLRQNPGKAFAIYCINHIAFPVLQRWSRSLRGDGVQKRDVHLKSFKHFSGLISHLVVEHLKISSNEECDPNVNLMLTQVLCLYIEISYVDASWPLKSLSCACFGHIISESHRYWTKDMWKIVCTAINILTDVQLRRLRQIVEVFPNKTINFYEDLAKVKVIKNRCIKAEEESVSSNEQINIAGFAHELFSLESQRGKTTVHELSGCTFVLQLERQDSEEKCAKELLFGDLVRDLLSQKSLLMTIAQMLLYNLPYELPTVASLHRTGTHGILIDQLDAETVQSVLNVFTKSALVSYEFDSRPGLKFLFQKLSNLSVPANLYYLSAISFGVKFLVSYHIFVRADNRENCTEQLRQLVEDVCEHYTDFILQTENPHNRLDELCQRPILLIPYKTNFDDFIKGDNLNGDQDEDDPGAADRAYRIIDHKQIEELTSNYKKWKQQHSPMPPAFNERIAQKNLLPKRRHFSDSSSLSDVEKQNEVCLLKDTDAYLCLWTQVLQCMIELHLSLPPTLFKELIPAFEPGIELLIMYATNRELRSVLALWIRQATASC